MGLLWLTMNALVRSGIFHVAPASLLEVSGRSQPTALGTNRSATEFMQ